MRSVINLLAARRLTMTSLLLVMAGMFVVTPALAEKPKKYNDWLYSCEKNKQGKSACFVSQTLSRKGKDNKKGGKVFVIKIGFMPGQKKPVAFMQVPLGVSLPPGLTFGIDKGKPSRWPYEFCGPEGCVVMVRMDDAMIVSMKRGSSAYAIIAGRDRKGQKLPISLKGFTAAYNALKKP